MNKLPSDTLVLLDASGVSFGVIRVVPNDSGSYHDCIFDVAPTSPEQALRDEVRWLCKRHYVHCSEHRLTLDDDGTVTVSKAGFKVVFKQGEDEHLATHGNVPAVLADWI